VKAGRGRGKLSRKIPILFEATRPALAFLSQRQRQRQRQLCSIPKVGSLERICIYRCIYIYSYAYTCVCVYMYIYAEKREREWAIRAKTLRSVPRH